MLNILRGLANRPAALSGVLLIAATIVAMVWANSPWRGAYEALWSLPVGFGLGGFELFKPLVLWVNDGLMAVFFLLVGLEIKREVLVGALSTRRRAALPLAAALGGVLVPAGLYLLVNRLPGGDPAGWAIPAATDIAFALGLLALLGSRAPVALRIFLTAVAVVDDLVAVAIIAVFFTAGLSWPALAVVAATIGALFAANRLGVRRTSVYVVLGLILWLGVLKSGLHATLAGVLLAAFIPGSGRPGDHGESPVVHWEHAIQPAVLFVIVPVFALANAGVSLAGAAAPGTGPIALGVALGLLVGKPLGITLFARLAVGRGLAELPRELSWQQLHAAGWLAGIGFTMSLFIGRLALAGPPLEAAKVGLLAGSALAAVIGSVLVWRAGRRRTVAPGLSGASADQHAGRAAG